MSDIRTLDLNLLKAFDALMDEKSVTKAAQHLSVTQPAMSGMLVRLREHFADPLFVRVQRGIEPTNRALVLASPVKQVLNQINAFLQPAQFDPQSAELTLSIACTDYALRAVIKPFLTALKQQAPHIKVALYSINEETAQTQLEKGILDFVLVTPSFTPPDVHHSHLYQEEYICIMHQDHPLAAQTELSLEQFCAYEHALVSYHGGAFSGITDESLAQLGKLRSVTLSVQNFLILPELLESTDMIAMVPKRLVSHLPNIKCFEPPFAVQGFTKTLAWHERTHHDPAYKWLRELIAESCRHS